ncbi:hypothetical protein MXB_1535 [Myxobolus squamalis]|nr:hypothetical protein MXB_1535 [Myxobolus squamalis]
MEKDICLRASIIEIDHVNDQKKCNLLIIRRYLILSVLAAALFCTGEAFVTFCYILPKNITLYHISSNNVNLDLFGIVFLILYAGVAILSPLICKKIGLKIIIVLGCYFNLTGVFLRFLYIIFPTMFEGYELDLILSENLFLSGSMGLLSCLASLLSVSCFNEKEYTMSILIPYMATSLGICVGFLNILITNKSINKNHLCTN